VRILDKIVPKRLREKLSWQYLHAAWWLWIIFGVSGGVALGFWLTQPINGIRMGPRTAIGIGVELSVYAFEKAKHPGQQFAFAVIITAPPENAVIGTFINEPMNSSQSPSSLSV
jgi:hypothetical protein